MRIWLLSVALSFVAAPLFAHDLPLSYVDLRLANDGVDATIEASAKNFARELPGTDEETLLANVPAQREQLLAAIGARLAIV
ncbi:MAG: hypothetical protein ABR526_09215, partial [Chthoniobacterales bacterium]